MILIYNEIKTLGGIIMIITCTECGKEFSDKASSCPNCGCPTEEVLSEINKSNNSNTTQISFLFNSPNGHEIVINDDSVSIYKKSKLKKEGTLDQLSWSDYSAPSGFLPGSINLKIGRQSLGYTFTFSAEDIEKIERLKSISKQNAYDIVKNISPTKVPDKRIKCPKCKSTNVGITGDRTKTTLNLNPLKPFTLVNHKVTKENWLCYDCGHRWNQKVK